MADCCQQDNETVYDVNAINVLIGCVITNFWRSFWYVLEKILKIKEGKNNDLEEIT
jgi:hypothetical protein